MSDKAHEVLTQALELPLDERAAVAAELLASLDGEPAPQVAAAWAAEIERRAQRMLSGEDPGERWSNVRAELWSEFGIK